ncbi:ECF-type sigma factor [Photobacterium aphoticum]|uniref:DNA-directed RNA polymerase subunit sigma n=2 Tax=Photobacterium aphoticum TaxID=754436 RepID=A0A0J1JJV4_9GAMM|nr:ECF-type sigma factor [Photobacterium aphoticum]KLV02277.1 DNA-directed RNA polymerase subunit sigma [Photobacterium aphoticum]PSU57741.1 RNA polymerase subunit sigma [Photobacterium aphoticum]GHA55151.1 DNA-directed RNA polymerase subunit sigma [Photobacterium aphoticum]
MQGSSSQPLTQIIQQWQTGDKQAESQLYQFAYLQLRKIAQQERARNAEKYGIDNHVLADSISSTTALIHDAYIKMSNSELADIENKRTFFLMAAKVMRQILIDNARTLQAQKRQQLTTIAGAPDTNERENRFEQLITIDKALDSFSVRYPRQSNALKLKYLMGMQNQEISELLECSASLIEKDLKFSRSWLQTRMA